LVFYGLAMLQLDADIGLKLFVATVGYVFSCLYALSGPGAAFI
jgi:hypothetical protein